MKPKLTFFLVIICCSSFLKLLAQPYTNLIYTEVRMDHTFNAYIELTNMGSETINLSQFKHNCATNFTGGYVSNPSFRLSLPDKLLAPGESWVISAYYDFAELISEEKPHKYSPISKPEMKTLANQFVYPQEHEVFPEENVAGRDTFSLNMGSHSLWSWNGRDGGWYLEWFSPDGTDSVIVDVVNLKWDGNTPISPVSDVAGVTGATLNTILIRKSNVTQGNTNWDDSRGTDLVDSEWLPVNKSTPYSQEYDRDPFWTIGNHGNFRLTANTLVSLNPEISVDYNAKTITVPWGIRQNDSIMRQMERKPGVAWYYHYSPNRADSAYTSIRNGDALSVYVAGNQLDVAKFDFIVLPAKNSDNIVIPKNRLNYSTNLYPAFRGAPFRVSDGIPGMDTISNVPFGTRTDSLIVCLEKPDAASWEFNLKNDEVRADLKDGDILVVTAGNGDKKEYYIKVNEFIGSENALLNSITWPDIPEFYKGIFGWKGDTIPNFAPTTFNYTLHVPFDVDNIPALVAKPQNTNTTVETIRAKSMYGSEVDRTITFITTSSTGTVKRTYTILLIKEKDPSHVQPWAAEPFISQYSHDEQGSNIDGVAAWNHAAEFYNPGTELIDFSNYMIIKGDGTPASVISGSGLSWANRFNRYIPGYQWADSITWALAPGTMVPDLNVNPFVYGGETFVVASAASTNGYLPYHVFEDNFDVNFRNVDNPWGLKRSDRYLGAISLNNNNTFWLFRIDNDSIKAGLKPTTDPNDFTLIDIFGNADNTPRRHMNDWSGLAGNQGNKRNYQRKERIYEGCTVPGAMFNNNDADSSEYRSYSQANLATLFGWDWTMSNWMVMGWLGVHDMNEVTVYQSTILSTKYKLTGGYGMDERIWGITTGTTVNGFLDNIIKRHPEQVLTLRESGGSVIEGAAVVNDGDFLEVVSADGQNNSRYLLQVSATGLSDNAILTSAIYTITVTGSTGTLGGLDYNATLRSVIDNIIVPEGATLTIVDNKDNYVPMKRLNNNLVYTDVKVSDRIYLEVVAENGITKILYQLTPTTLSGDAFLVSQVYNVDNVINLIDWVESGTLVSSFLANVVPSAGATITIVDKLGFPRTSGTLRVDDIIIVTAEDGVSRKQYFIRFLNTVSNLAYVTSDKYSVDQIRKLITDPDINTEVSLAAFVANLIVSQGAAMEIVDSEGVVKTEGNMNVGDQVKVTAPDGVTIIYYAVEVEVVTGIGQNRIQVKIYPNPTTGVATVSGLEPGSRVFIYNSLGVMTRVYNVISDQLVISLENQPGGIYYVIIESTVKTRTRFNLIKL
jgi:hypothetical protein